MTRSRLTKADAEALGMTEAEYEAQLAQSTSDRLDAPMTGATSVVYMMEESGDAVAIEFENENDGPETARKPN